jgi:Ser/Thr protein kinase RdoA (MazF antagonist)
VPLGTNKLNNQAARIHENLRVAMGVGPNAIRLSRWSKGGGLFPVVHSWGVVSGVPFFAKTFVAELYPVTPRVVMPWEWRDTLDQETRSGAAQVEIEWNMTNEMRALGGSRNVPPLLGKSGEAKTIVWEGLQGTRLDRLVRRGVWSAGARQSSSEASFQAGLWLRKIHRGSARGEETIYVTQMLEALKEWGARSGQTEATNQRIALRILKEALAAIGGKGAVRSDTVLSHGDLSLSNMAWDANASRLFLFDFEHADYRSACHDLITVLFSLSTHLFNPLISRKDVEVLRDSFWSGYGPVSQETSCLVGAVAMSRMFYYYLPRISTRGERRGWLRGFMADSYLTFLKEFIVGRRLGISLDN